MAVYALTVLWRKGQGWLGLLAASIALVQWEGLSQGTRQRGTEQDTRCLLLVLICVHLWAHMHTHTEVWNAHGLWCSSSTLRSSSSDRLPYVHERMMEEGFTVASQLMEKDWKCPKWLIMAYWWSKLQQTHAMKPHTVSEKNEVKWSRKRSQRRCKFPLWSLAEKAFIRTPTSEAITWKTDKFEYCYSLFLGKQPNQQTHHHQQNYHNESSTVVKRRKLRKYFQLIQKFIKAFLQQKTANDEKEK